MKDQIKKRKHPEWDPIRKLSRGYQTKIKAAYKEINDLARTGCSGKVQTPNYAKEVISPLAKVISEKMSGIEISVNEAVEVYNAKDAFFKIFIGEHTLGGFSYPGLGVNQINFTVFAHDKPWGRAIHITSLPQMIKVITDLIDFLNLNKNENDDVK